MSKADRLVHSCVCASETRSLPRVKMTRKVGNDRYAVRWSFNRAENFGAEMILRFFK